MTRGTRAACAAAMMLAASAVAQVCTPDPKATAAQIALATGAGAPVLSGLGDHAHTITTKSEEAQRFFNQGLIMHYAFNHREAVRAFRHASELDPEAPMPFWGIALSLGPHINSPMDPEAAAPAMAALRQAKAKAGNGTARERAYIEALSARYADDAPEDRSSLDQAYAEAMRRLARQYPDDLDAQTLMAEAVMCTSPWDYWLPNKTLREPVAEARVALERVMERDPDNPGANHLYIHVVEAGPTPEVGIPAADRLRDLVPVAGHLVHMPAHIYVRTGMYHEASRSNVMAIKADRDYFSTCGMQGFYPLAYYPHNWHFLWFSSMIEGRSAESLRAARIAGMNITDDFVEAPRLRVMIPCALVRFERWDEILRLQQPPTGQLFETGMWRYARGLAYVGKGQVDRAKAELAGLSGIIESDEGKALEMPFFYGLRQLQIAQDVLAAAVASADGKSAEAIALLHKAVTREDGMPYMEPSYWYYPVRQSLGAALMSARKFSEAESVFREDLRRNPSNGWSLAGLARALRAQGKTAAAEEVEAWFHAAWIRADSPVGFGPF